MLREDQLAAGGGRPSSTPHTTNPLPSDNPSSLSSTGSRPTTYHPIPYRTYSSQCVFSGRYGAHCNISQQLLANRIVQTTDGNVSAAWRAFAQRRLAKRYILTRTKCMYARHKQGVFSGIIKSSGDRNTGCNTTPRCSLCSPSQPRLISHVTAQPQPRHGISKRLSYSSTCFLSPSSLPLQHPPLVVFSFSHLLLLLSPTSASSSTSFLIVFQDLGILFLLVFPPHFL